MRFGFNPVNGALHEFGSIPQMELILDVRPVGFDGFDTKV